MDEKELESALDEIVESINKENILQAPPLVEFRGPHSEALEYLKEESHANIQGEKGILNRQIRSIQTEGHFGDIKENDGFRRFNYRTAEKVYKEFMLYAIGRNINKYHRFLHDEIKKFEGKTEEKAA